MPKRPSSFASFRITWPMQMQHYEHLSYLHLLVQAFMTHCRPRLLFNLVLREHFGRIVHRIPIYFYGLLERQDWNSPSSCCYLTHWAYFYLFFLHLWMAVSSTSPLSWHLTLPIPRSHSSPIHLLLLLFCEKMIPILIPFALVFWCWISRVTMRSSNFSYFLFFSFQA